MPATLRAVLSLLIGIGLLTAANALLATVVSVRMTIDGFPRLLSGLVMSAYFAGFVLGSLHAPRLVERVGHIRAFAAFAAGLGVAATMQALVIAPLPWIVLRAAVGFSIAGELMVAESWLNTKATTANRGRVFSLYTSVIYLSFGGGQFLLAVGDPAGVDLFLVVMLLLSASILTIVLTRAGAPRVVLAPRLHVRRLYEVAPLGLAGVLVAGVTIGSIQSIGPQFARELGLSTARISQFMGVFFLSGLLLQWPVGWMSDHTDRRRVLAVMALGAALACAAIAMAGHRSFALLAGLAVVAGATAATLYALSVAHANDRLPDDSVVAITSTLLLANGVGAMTGPILAAAVMTLVGAAGLFYMAAVPCALLGVYALYRIRTYAPVEQDRFALLAQTTTAVLELDPRGPVPSGPAASHER